MHNISFIEIIIPKNATYIDSFLKLGGVVSGNRKDTIFWTIGQCYFITTYKEVNKPYIKGIGLNTYNNVGSTTKQNDINIYHTNRNFVEYIKGYYNYKWQIPLINFEKIELDSNYIILTTPSIIDTARKLKRKGIHFYKYENFFYQQLIKEFYPDSLFISQLQRWNIGLKEITENQIEYQLLPKPLINNILNFKIIQRVEKRR